MRGTIRREKGLSILNGLLGGRRGCGCGILGDDDCLDQIVVIGLIFLFICCCCKR